MSASVTYLETTAQRHKLKVVFPVNHRASYLMENITTHADQDATAVLDLAAANYENGVKTEWPEWLTQDVARDATVEGRTLVRDNPYSDGYSFWDQTVTFTITNATVKLEIECETAAPLGSEDCNLIFQAVGDQAVSDWFAGRPFTAL